MKQIPLLFLSILVPFLSFGQDLNGKWTGLGVQKIGNAVFTFDIEMVIKQEGNKLSGKMLSVSTGTENHSIARIDGTIKEGKVKIHSDNVIKIHYPKTNFEGICFRNYRGNFTIDEVNNVLVMELETYGIDLKYHLATKTYSDGTCPPSILRMTKKYREAENESELPKSSIASESKKEIKLSTKIVKIKVWDKYEEDGDLINLYLNGKLLFANLEVTKKGQLFEIELLSGENIIEAEAINEGKVSPNTSAIRIFTDNKEHDIILSARKGGRDSLKIILD